MTAHAAPPEPRCLHTARPGETVRVLRLAGQKTVCHRLREMGFCEQAEVRVISASAGVICLVCGARVCLSRQLAESIHVAPAA